MSGQGDSRAGSGSGADAGSAASAGAGGASVAAGSSTANHRLSNGLLLTYAAGSPGMGVWVAVPGLLLLFYMTDVLRVAPEIAGLALLLPKVIDVVMHPFFGTTSDRLLRRYGNRRQMMWVGLLLAVAMIAAFSAPSGMEGLGAALWVAVFYILGNVLFACFQVPYLTVPSDLQVSYYERGRIMTFRTVALTVGLVVVGALAPMLVKSGERSAYTQMAVVMSVIMVVSGVIAIFGIRRMQRYASALPEQQGAHKSAWAGIKYALADRDFRILVIAYLLTVTTTHIFLAGAPYFATYYFNSTGLTSVLTAAFLVPAVFAGPVWLIVSRRIGKQRGLLISQGIFIVGIVALYVGPEIGIAGAVAVIVVLGIAFAGMQLFAFSMLPDVARAHGRDSTHAAAFTGVWTATEATGTALGPYVYSTVLAIGGFVASSAGDHVQQSPGALGALLLGFTLVPAVLMVAAFLVQRKYSLDGSPADNVAADDAELGV